MSLPNRDPESGKTNGVRESFNIGNAKGKEDSNAPPKDCPTRFWEWLTWYKAVEIIFAMGTFVFIVIIGIDMVQLYDINEDFINYDAGHGPLLLNMIGDSLINHPFNWFNLPDKVNFFVNYQFTIGNYGEDGNEIAQIARRIDTAIKNPTPDCLVLFWDSDCSNINEYVLTEQQNYMTRQYYVQNLSYVINATLSAGVKKMLVGGPELLGEAQFLLQHLFWHKVNMLNDYRHLNEYVTAAYNVQYIDVRHKFIKDLPWWWGFNQWYMTREGEHENARGTRVVARLFGEPLQQWLIGYNASLFYGPSPKATAVPNSASKAVVPLRIEN